VCHMKFERSTEIEIVEEGASSFPAGTTSRTNEHVRRDVAVVDERIGVGLRSLARVRALAFPTSMFPLRLPREARLRAGPRRSRTAMRRGLQLSSSDSDFPCSRTSSPRETQVVEEARPPRLVVRGKAGHVRELRQ